MKKVKRKNLSKSKKVKRKKDVTIANDRKPVTSYAEFTATASKEGEIKLNLGKDGVISCLEPSVSKMRSYTAYPRASGKNKIVTQSSGSGNSAIIRQRENIERNYDLIAGIDTSNYVINGRKLSITSTFCSDVFLKQHSSSVNFLIAPAFCIAEVSPEINPEVIGWHLFIKHIAPLLTIGPSRRLGLVSDSELGKHPLINDRKEPYYRDHFLPEHMGIIYASADTGTDVPNKLIKTCDKATRDLHQRIINGDINLPALLGGGTQDYAGYAYINFTTSPYQIMSH